MHHVVIEQGVATILADIHGTGGVVARGVFPRTAVHDLALADDDLVGSILYILILHIRCRCRRLGGICSVGVILVHLTVEVQRRFVVGRHLCGVGVGVVLVQRHVGCRGRCHTLCHIAIMDGGTILAGECLVVDQRHTVDMYRYGVYHRVIACACIVRSIVAITVVLGISYLRVGAIALCRIGDVKQVVPSVGRLVGACLLAHDGRILLRVVDIVEFLAVAALDGERHHALTCDILYVAIRGRLHWQHHRLVERLGVNGECQLIVDAVDRCIRTVHEAYLLAVTVAAGKQGLDGALQVGGRLAPGTAVGQSVVRLLTWRHPEDVHLVAVGGILQLGVRIFIHTYIYIGLVVCRVRVIGDAIQLLACGSRLHVEFLTFRHVEAVVVIAIEHTGGGVGSLGHVVAHAL